jgi:acyl-CoA thioesterase
VSAPPGSPDAERELAERVVRQMMRHDAFSQWLGIDVVEVAPAACTVRMTVRPEMTNGFGVCHGGVTFALADSALAFASNTHGRVTVSVHNAIRYPAAVHPGDVLTASCVREGGSNRLAYYRVHVTKPDGALVAVFDGTVYATDRPHFAER